MFNWLSNIATSIKGLFIGAAITLGIVSSPQPTLPVQELAQEIVQVTATPTPSPTPTPTPTQTKPAEKKEAPGAVQIYIQSIINPTPTPTPTQAPTQTTSPSPTPTPTPTPVIVEMRIPTKLKVYPWGSTDDRTLDNTRDSTIYISAGAGCEPRTFEVTVLDQNGNTMFDKEISFMTPEALLTKTITSASRISNNATGIGFWYTPMSTSTTEIITVRSGNLSVSGPMTIGNRMAEMWEQTPDRFRLSDGVWYEESSGVAFDPITMTCPNKQGILR